MSALDGATLGFVVGLLCGVYLAWDYAKQEGRDGRS